MKSVKTAKVPQPLWYNRSKKIIHFKFKDTPISIPFSDIKNLWKRFSDGNIKKRSRDAFLTLPPPFALETPYGIVYVDNQWRVYGLGEVLK